MHIKFKWQAKKKWICILIYTEKGAHHFGIQYSIHEAQTFETKAAILCPFSTESCDTGSTPKINVIISIFLRLKYDFWCKNCQVIFSSWETGLAIEHGNVTRLVLSQYAGNLNKWSIPQLHYLSVFFSL